jgi:hypothetical protein
MRDRLIGLLEQADLAIASCADVLDQSTLEPLIASVAAVRTRLAHPEDIIVVALAGGTGSGKSSLFNALSGDDLTEVGGVRPTTSQPAVAVPDAAGEAMDGYLDRLDITERHIVDVRGVCLIDLPDTDSVELDHRHRVDQLLPLVDVVVWVADPEKYRDARLHHGYLAPLAAYSGQFLFVLNQIDRLRPDDAEAVVADFENALLESGFDRAEVVPVAVAPTSGPPLGMGPLVDAIEDKRARSETLYGKLLTDLTLTARTLAETTGVPVDFDRRAGEVVARAEGHIAAGTLEKATEDLVGFLDHVADEVGGPTARWIRRVTADVPRHVERIGTTTRGSDAPRRRRWGRARVILEPDPPPTGDLLVEAVVRPARAILAKRALAIASVADLALTVEDLARRTAH